MAEHDEGPSAGDQDELRELKRTLNHKQKILEKFNQRPTRTLDDGDITTSAHRARAPRSRLLGTHELQEVAVGDEDPTDSILYTDFDMSPDPVTVTDVDPTDPSHHPFPA
jgi:hypothetical protein